jgi:thiamine kinase-like enzyme
LNEKCLRKMNETMNNLEKSKFISVCHNDLWIHNLLFKNSLLNRLDEMSKGKTFEEVQYEIFNPDSDLLNGIKIFDFEYISYGSPLVDLAFFLYTSVNNQDLRSYENEFIKFYYSCISFNGIFDYSIDECFEDYFHARDLQFLRIMSISENNVNFWSKLL